MIIIKENLINRKIELEKLRRATEQRLSKLKYKGTPKCHIRIDSKKDQIYMKVDGDNKEISWCQQKDVCKTNS